MAIDYDTLKNWKIPEVEQKYTFKDTILYALGLGIGQDPLDREQLRYVYEDGLKALPTQAVVLGYPGFWLKEPGTGVDWKQILHGEQGMRIHRLLPVEGHVVGRTRVEEIVDKGEGRGALVLTTRDIIDVASGELLVSLTSTTFARANGGFGGPKVSAPAPHPMPEGAPERSFEWKTAPGQALIYRLNGDYNPLHADPEVAMAGGFKMPILHGLASYGIAGHAILRMFCGNDPSRLRRLDVRFSSPVFPGETLRTEAWATAPGTAAFRVRSVERDIVVINNGRADFTT